MNTLERVSAKIASARLEAEVNGILWAYGVTLEEVAGRRRMKHIVTARREIMWLFREKLKWSYPAIGDLFGRDHSSVMALLKGKEDVVVT